MPNFSLTVENKKFEQAINAFGEEAVKALEASLFQYAHEILGDIVEKNIVPKDTGNLANNTEAQFVRRPERSGAAISVELGFGGTAAPYARAVHENPRAGKTGGVSPSGRRYKTWAKVGGYKYLERPINEERSKFSRKMRALFWLNLSRLRGRS